MKKIGGQKRVKGPSANAKGEKVKERKKKKKKKKKFWAKLSQKTTNFFFSYMREASREKRYEYDLSSDDDDRNCVAGEY